jgi:hypothetical protein
MTDSGAQSLLAWLRSNRTLQVLSLKANDFSCATLNAFLAFLRRYLSRLAVCLSLAACV